MKFTTLSQFTNLIQTPRIYISQRKPKEKLYFSTYQRQIPKSLYLKRLPLELLIGTAGFLVCSSVVTTEYPQFLMLSHFSLHLLPNPPSSLPPPSWQYPQAVSAPPDFFFYLVITTNKTTDLSQIAPRDLLISNFSLTRQSLPQTKLPALSPSASSFDRSGCCYQPPAKLKYNASCRVLERPCKQKWV